jgi:phage recombination protein Bet
VTTPTTPTTPTTEPSQRALALSPMASSQITSANELAEALKAVQAAIAPELNPHELRLFAMVAYRSGLDPFAKQIYATKRDGRVTFQTGIDGFRSTAERSGEYDGQDEPVYGPPCSCKDAPQPHPEWASVTVYRQRPGMPRRGQTATARWHEYKPAPGRSGNADAQWKKMPTLMLGKCAEALAFRKAFPYVLADIYSPEEMAQAGAGPVVLEHRPTAREAVAARRAEVEADESAATEPEVSGTAPDVAADNVVEGEAREVDEDAWAGNEPVLTELSAAAFKALREQHDIPPAQVAAAARELFPEATGLNDLTDEQRAALWQALEPKDTQPA